MNNVKTNGEPILKKKVKVKHLSNKIQNKLWNLSDGCEIISTTLHKKPPKMKPSRFGNSSNPLLCHTNNSKTPKKEEIEQHKSYSERCL